MLTIKEKLLTNLNIIIAVIAIISAMATMYSNVATKEDLKNITRKAVFSSIDTNIRINKIHLSLLNQREMSADEKLEYAVLLESNKELTKQREAFINGQIDIN